MSGLNRDIEFVGFSGFLGIIIIILFLPVLPFKRSNFCTKISYNFPFKYKLEFDPHAMPVRILIFIFINYLITFINT